MTAIKNLVGKQERVVFVDQNVSVRDAAKAMAQSNVGCTAVMNEGLLVGLFTERDVLKRVLLQDLDVDEVLVGDVMTREIITIDGETDIRLARNLMKDRHIRHLPVIEEATGTLIGVLSIRDLVLEEIAEVQKYLHLEES